MQLNYKESISDLPEIERMFQSSTSNLSPEVSISNVDLCIRIIEQKGRALFARDKIYAKQKIAVAPAYQVPQNDLDMLKQCDVYKYVFYDTKKFDKRGSIADGYFLFGSFSFCNHSENPNASVVWHYENAVLSASLQALADISADEEITIKYSNIIEYENCRDWV
jgi:uncharacterized protein